MNKAKLKKLEDQIHTGQVCPQCGHDPNDHRIIFNPWGGNNKPVPEGPPPRCPKCGEPAYIVFNPWGHSTEATP